MNFKLIIIDNIFNYFASLKEKIANLSETNYQLGLEHLKNGHIWEALSRFKIITFFWPHHRKALYQYAYCLILANKIENARKVLTKLLAEFPNYQEAMNLFKAIQNQETDKIKQEYKEKLLR